KSEVDFLMPDIESGNIIRGTIDLIAFYKDRIEIFDYKTDKNKNNLEKYKMQLSVYKKALKEIYKDKKLIAKIFFVSLDEIEEVA
ncbi:MAG: PD-(D/E)XK nuclease family protein, partial [Ignavibacteria bacterium]